jgi:DNA-binding transcriptional MerR regulator
MFSQLIKIKQTFDFFPSEYAMGHSIKFVSQVTNINEHTIRAWEKRYGLIRPDRDNNGKRVFNDDQIQLLSLVKDLLQENYAISELARLPHDELDKLHDKHKTTRLKRTSLKNISDESEEMENIIFDLAIHSKRWDILMHELEYPGEQHVRHFVSHKIIPLYKKILAHKGQLGPVHFHSFLQVQRTELLKLINTLSAQQKEFPMGRILVGSFGGIESEVEVLIQALGLIEDGHQIITIGHNIRAEELNDLITAYAPTSALMAQEKSAQDEVRRLNHLQFKEVKRARDVLYRGQFLFLKAADQTNHPFQMPFPAAVTANAASVCPYPHSA